jgi:hypothetical protein
MTVYVAAGVAKAQANLEDCNLVGQNDPRSLCVSGGNFIKNNRTAIRNQYQNIITNLKTAYGTTKPIFLHIEPDFYQYYSDPRQTNPLTLQETWNEMNVYTDLIKAEMPNATLVMDISPWNPNIAQYSSGFRNFSYSGLVGKVFPPNGSDGKTYAQMSAATGLPIIINTAHGPGGALVGHQGQWDSRAVITQAASEGVVGLIQSAGYGGDVPRFTGVIQEFLDNPVPVQSFNTTTSTTTSTPTTTGTPTTSSGSTSSTTSTTTGSTTGAPTTSGTEPPSTSVPLPTTTTGTTTSTSTPTTTGTTSSTTTSTPTTTGTTSSTTTTGTSTTTSTPTTTGTTSSTTTTGTSTTTSTPTTTGTTSSTTTSTPTTTGTTSSTTTGTPTNTVTTSNTGGNTNTSDSDNDGIPDLVEQSCTIASSLFTINTYAGGEDCDADNDGIPDYQDTDSDNDGIPDSIEKGSTCQTLSNCVPIDTDSNGLADYRQPNTSTVRTGGIQELMIAILIVISIILFTIYRSGKKKNVNQVDVY